MEADGGSQAQGCRRGALCRFLFPLLLTADAALNECHSVPHVSKSISRDTGVSVKWPWKEKTTGQSCVPENSHPVEVKGL